jgi:hypothetical protein
MLCILGSEEVGGILAYQNIRLIGPLRRRLQQKQPTKRGCTSYLVFTSYIIQYKKIYNKPNLDSKSHNATPDLQR